MKKKSLTKNRTEVADLAVNMPITRDCVGDIRAIIANARRSLVRHVNTVQVLANWLIGRRIVVEEQKGAKRAAYREHLLSRISSELGADYGEGFSEPQLRNCRLFFKAFPTEEQIRYTLCIKLSWSHLRLIMRVGDRKSKTCSSDSCVRSRKVRNDLPMWQISMAIFIAK